MNKFHAFLVEGKTLIVRLINKTTTEYKKDKEVATLYNKDQVIGYNIFNVELPNKENGLLKYDKEIEALVNKALATINQQPLEMDDISKYFVIGYVKELEKHPESTRLHIAQVDLKDEVLQIVCGAKNIEQGQKVVVAKPNAVLFNGTWIGKGKLLKVDSAGMICSSKELGLTKESNGILVLEDSAVIGNTFFNEN
ncbi:YtpR family tRNA-binding protein [Mycoplasma sp. P36-A1]|uniref:YtpR family tRNA-binding protein n=1 Tax=Mycoplasma sp. P36-A1 TaxID=3252900 RepID=UPI003C2BB932